MEKYCNADVYVLNESIINGRKVALYAISSPLSDIYLVDYEKSTKEIERLFFTMIDEAEKRYNAILMQIIKGKL